LRRLGQEVCLRQSELTLDAKQMYLLEDWQPTTSKTGAKGATQYLALIDDFQMRTVAAAKRIAMRSGSGSSTGDKDGVPGNFKKKIKETFVDTLCYLFDGVLNVATAPTEFQMGRRPSRLSKIPVVKDVVCVIISVFIAPWKHPIWTGVCHANDQQETRLLVTLAQFDHLKSTQLPSMISRLGKLLDADTDQDEATLMDVAEHMDGIVFGDYVKRRSEPLVELVKGGILDGGIDWLSTPKPTGTLFFPRLLSPHGRMALDRIYLRYSLT
jgi:exocyst complex component 2